MPLANEDKPTSWAHLPHVGSFIGVYPLQNQVGGVATGDR